MNSTMISYQQLLLSPDSNQTGIEPFYVDFEYQSPDCATNTPLIHLLHQIIYSIVCVAGLCGNTMVIYVVLRFSKMQTVTNTYILNLAIADECFLIGIPFLVTTIHLGSWIFGETLCRAYMASTSINQFTSSLFLLIMSADRYIAVCHPVTSPKLRTPLIARLVALAAWTTSAVFMSPVLLYTATSVHQASGRVSCNIYWPGAAGQTTFTLYTFVLSFALPLAFIGVFYYLVVYKLRHVGPKNKSREKKRSNRKVTRLVLTVIAVYAFCWLPYWLTQLALVYTEPNQCQSAASRTSFLLAGFLAYSNSAMNPILYAFLSDNFKKSFRKACACLPLLKEPKPHPSMHQDNSVIRRRRLAAAAERAREANVACKPVVSTSSEKNDEDDEGNGDRGRLLRKASSTTVTTSSRSNITVSSEPQQQKDHQTKNQVEQIADRTKIN